MTLISLIGLNGCGNSEAQDYAEMLIGRVELFKTFENRLPKNVSELGLEEKLDSPAFYQLETDSTYKVWYGLGLGESKVYRSLTRKWTKEG